MRYGRVDTDAAEQCPKEGNLPGRVGAFHDIQSRTRVMGWHFSPRLFCGSQKTRFN
jgi:hypothetical protein